MQVSEEERNPSCLSVVLYLDNGDYPNICMLCFVLINSALLNPLCLRIHPNLVSSWLLLVLADFWLCFPA